MSDSLQPMDCSLPASSVHGILQAGILKWVAISFSRDLPDPGIEPGSPALQADSLLSEPLRNPMVLLFWSKIEHDLTARNLSLFLLSDRKRPGFMKSTWVTFRFRSCLCCILGIYCLSLILSVSL